MPRLVAHPGADAPPGRQAHDGEQDGGGQRGDEPLGARHEGGQPGPERGGATTRGVQRGHDVHAHPEGCRHPGDPVPGDHPVQPGTTLQPRGAGGEHEPAEGGKGGQEAAELADRQRGVDPPADQLGQPAGDEPQPHRDGRDPRHPRGGVTVQAGRAPGGAGRDVRPRGCAAGAVGVAPGGRSPGRVPPGAGCPPGRCRRVRGEVVGTPGRGARRWFQRRGHASMLAPWHRLGVGQSAVRGPSLRSSYTGVNCPGCPYRTTIQLLSQRKVSRSPRRRPPRPCAACGGHGWRGGRCPRWPGTGSAAGRRR